MEKINIVIASDSFKGSLSSIEVADSMERGFLKTKFDLNIKKFSIADGGEGTVEALSTALSGRVLEFPVRDVFMRPTVGKLGLIDDKMAVIEAASPLGLDKLADGEINPYKATSYGLGELIGHALDLGIEDLYIGLGGSAVNDGGLGLIKALGAKCLDEDGQEVENGVNGLRNLSSIDISNLDKRLETLRVYLLLDVTNPLCGPQGATYVYGPQKGLKKEDLEEVDESMRNYGLILEDLFKKDIIDFSGSGAAGGLGACLRAFLDAQMTKGIEKILEMIKIEDALKDAHLVFTGEGKMDGQSAFGKAPTGLAKLAKKYDLPVIAIVGSAANISENLIDGGIDLILDTINEPMTLDYAMKNASKLVENQAYMALKHYEIWKNLI